jgi:hypothetical protein
VRWGIARNVMVAWFITIPASASVAAIVYYMVSGTPARAAMIAAIIALVSFVAFAWRGSRAPGSASA